MRVHPPCTARGNSNVGPHRRSSKVERPRSPIGASPVFGLDHGHVACWRCHAARPSSTSIGRCSPAPAARCSPTRCAPPGSCRGRFRASGCCSASSTRSARRCRRWRSPAKRSRSSKGRPRDRVQAAAESVAEQLASMVQPFAESVFARHRAAGPTARCSPPPRRTTWSSRSPTGSGSTTWWPPGGPSTPTAPTTARSPGRSSGRPASSQPSATWADEHDVDLDESYAYSDSVYDAPLLGAVGVPDRRQPRPADDGDREGPPLAGAQPRRVAGCCEDPVRRARVAAAGDAAHPAGVRAVRPFRVRRSRATCRRPGRRSSSPTTARTSTPLAISMLIAKTGRTVRFLGKKEVFDAPLVGQLAAAMGGIRVDRGTGSDEPLTGGGRGADWAVRW